MTKILVPSGSALAWKPLLAQPDKHWKASYSAMSLAQCWESTPRALPREIESLFETAGYPELQAQELLFAIPEYQVELPGGTTASQTDVFALLRGQRGLIACAVEGKVDEEFGPTIEAKTKVGAAERLKYLHDMLEIDSGVSGNLRYQLFHRTVAAIILAKQFFAPTAVMIVQSFSPEKRGFSDFEAFGSALGVVPQSDRLYKVGKRVGVDLFIGWACGDQRFRKDLSNSAY